MKYETASFEDLSRDLFYAGHPYLLPHNVKAFRARYHGGVARLVDTSSPIGPDDDYAREYFTVESVQAWDGSRLYRVLRVVVKAYSCPTCLSATGRYSAEVYRNLAKGLDETVYPSAKAARKAINRHLAQVLGEAPTANGHEVEYV